MGRSLYRLPTRYLVVQGFQTSHELQTVVRDGAPEAWTRAGVDVAARSREVTAVFEALWEAQTQSVLAGANLRVARRMSVPVVAEAAVWMGWLADVADEAARGGQRHLLLTSVRRVRHSTPSLPWVTEHVRSLVADVARERAKLARYTVDGSLLDEGARHLAALEAAALEERDAAVEDRRAAEAEAQARARFTDVFRQLDREVARVARVLGRTPTGGASRGLLRAETNRRAAAAKRRKGAVTTPARAEAPALDA